MKKLILLFVSIFLSPGAFAQTEYQQKTFIFSIPEGSEIPGDSGKECEEGLDFIAYRYDIHDINPSWTLKRKIYTVRTWARTGKVIDNEVNQIGEILACVDFQSYLPDRNLVPMYYEITIGGRKYRAAGGGTSPKFPEYDVMPGGGQFMTPIGYPEANVANVNYTATVLPSNDGKPGGMFYISNLANTDGVNREYYDHYTIGVLRVLIPVIP